MMAGWGASRPKGAVGSNNDESCFAVARSNVLDGENFIDFRHAKLNFLTTALLAVENSSCEPNNRYSFIYLRSTSFR